MGRFDALTQIDENLSSPTPSSVVPSPTSTRQQRPPDTKEHTDYKLSKSPDLLANQQASKPASKKTNLLANQQTGKEVNQQASLPTNAQTSNLSHQGLSTKEKKKYGTYLREDSISAIQVHTIQTRRKDHEVLQQAVDQYFEKIK